MGLSGRGGRRVFSGSVMSTAKHCARRKLAAALTLLAALQLPLRLAAAEPPPTDSMAAATHAQAILAARCAACHGAEKHEAGLRVDQTATLLGGGDSGAAVVPGKSGESLLWQRMSATDDTRMPPPDGAPALSADEIAAVARWIDSGALAWPNPAAAEPLHWAYRGVQRPVPPQNQVPETRQNAIDAFVAARLASQGVAPSPPADAATLIKRLSYDLLGLPPDPADVDRFVADESPEAYRRLVDRLLESPHFGERWGRHWLDMARYADSDGYEKDNPRPDAWRFRDWVIEAVNRDLPLDEFTIWQLAGDLLPDATPQMRLATAFNRQTLTNTEGGADQEQFRFEALFDRVNTLGTVWLGLTVGCAQCHSHKYDQLTQAEYYRLLAFFNNGDEATTEVAISPEALRRHAVALAAHEAQLTALRAEYAAYRETLLTHLPLWEAALREKLSAAAADPLQEWTLEASELSTQEGVPYARQTDGSYLAPASGTPPGSDVITLLAPRSAGAVRALRLEALRDETLPEDGPGRASNGNFVLNEIRVWAGATAELGDSHRVALASARAGFSAKDFPVAGALDGENKTGWSIAPRTGQNHWAVFEFAAPLPPEATLVKIELAHGHGKSHILGRFRIRARAGVDPDTIAPAEIRRIAALPDDGRTTDERTALIDFFAPQDPRAAELLAGIQQHIDAVPDRPYLDVRVIKQRTRRPRTTHVLRRGDFLQPGEAVEPAAPAVLPPLTARDPAAPDRLDLARWLVSPQHPLTPRVMVNHIWRQLFGQGLVDTPGDWGVRGTPPEHPELLDWLATELVARGWSRKEMIRLIVSSATYQQASAQRSDVADRDPQNRLWHRQNRWRVEGEVLRDLTLAASGLMSATVGGPSVFPLMPEDVAKLSYANNFTWKTSEGGDRCRRGMYTFFKRTAPHPNLSLFDCPDANVTCVSRQTSNTPVQALALLNEAACFEAAQALARHVEQPVVDELEALVPADRIRLTAAWRHCLARQPAAEELATLESLLAQARAWYAARPSDAQALCAPRELAPRRASEQAAWIAVCRIVLNLDEFLSRE